MHYVVNRHSFYDTPQKTLRFTEVSPSNHKCKVCDCNCTKTVNERPEGVPQSVQQYIEAIDKDFMGRHLKFTITENFFGYNFYWEDPKLQENKWTKDSRRNYYGKNCSAHFNFGKNCECKSGLMKNAMSFCTNLIGYSEIELICGKIHFGNQVDRENLWIDDDNWYPDFNSFEPDCVFAHSRYNKNSIQFMRDCKEKETWKILKQEAEEIKLMSGNDLFISVDEVRKNVEGKEKLEKYINHAAMFLSGLLDNFEKSELFRCVDLVQNF